MAYSVKNLISNDDVKVVDKKHGFTVIEYQRDLSVTPATAQKAYFSSLMNIRKRQLICDVSQGSVVTQAGAMQWMLGNELTATTGLKGAGDLMMKAFRGSVTGESAIKPEYKGDGILVLEPTYKYLLLIDTSEWNGFVMLEDGMFLAAEGCLEQKAVARSNISSAALGGQGLFNLGIKGNGVVAVESPCPKEELIEIELNNDVLKVDGNMVIAWSGTLNFTVEKAGKSLLGSATSGEGLVNVFRGTGKLLLAPVSGKDKVQPLDTEGWQEAISGTATEVAKTTIKNSVNSALRG